MNAVIQIRCLCLLGFAMAMLAVGCHRKGSDGTGTSPSVTLTTAAGIHDLLGAPAGRVTLLHLWATWCPPCVQEFPDIVALTRKYHERGLRVLLVSADAESDADAVTRFLADHGVNWQTYLADNVNDSFIKAVSPKWSGALPASFYYSADGTLLSSWEGSRPYETHEKMVLELLKEQQQTHEKGR